jgi:ATP-dependent DNA helicase RecQ
MDAPHTTSSPSSPPAPQPAADSEAPESSVEDSAAAQQVLAAAVEEAEEVEDDEPESELEAKLREVFGFNAFRPLQEDAVRATLDGEDVLVVMPTGAGKSLCFQLPAAISDGVTLVVSPLVALMRDQVLALNARTSFANLGCAYLNSLQGADEQRQVLDDLRHGMLKLVYVAPERFRSAGFRAALSQVTIDRFVVDEAHCISEWGHDFRPDYLALRPFVQEAGHPPILAVTATATRRVQDSIIENLGMGREGREPQVLVGGFDRPNLHFSVHRCPSDRERDELLAKALPKLCARGGSGLIYASTRKQCEEVAALASRALATQGFKAAAYHAGIDADTRNALQQAWLDSEVQVLVATNAFGMGIDKPDVRFVIHYGIPDSLENYYQEAGRAGRDGRGARVVILYRPGDKKLREFFIEREGVEGGDVRMAFARMVKNQDEAGEVLVPREWWRQQFRDMGDHTVRLVWRELEKEGCVRRIGESPDGTRVEILKSQFPLSAMNRIRQDFEVQKTERLRRLNEMVDYCRTPECRRQTILGYFGDFEDLPARRLCCDNCDSPPSAKPVPEAGARPAPRAGIGVPLNIDGGDVHALLQGMDALYPKVGKARLNKILRGANSKDVQRFRDDDHPLLGVLRGANEKSVEDFLSALIAAGFLHQADEEAYYIVSVSVAGREAWQNKLPVAVDSPLSKARRVAGASGGAKGASTAGAPKFGGAFENEADEELFEKLRDWRRGEASAAGLPGYCVLADRTLGEIAVARPTSRDELAGVHGMGPMKIEKYGEAILEVLAG